MTEEIVPTEPLVQGPDDFDRLAIGRSLHIADIEDMQKHQGRLDRILEWAKMKGATNQTEALAELNHLKTTIGNPSIYDLSAYISLEMDHLSALQQKTALEEKLSKTESTLKKFKHGTGRNEKGQFTA